jgi:hypothetical protein
VRGGIVFHLGEYGITLGQQREQVFVDRAGGDQVEMTPTGGNGIRFL